MGLKELRMYFTVYTAVLQLRLHDTKLHISRLICSSDQKFLPTFQLNASDQTEMRLKEHRDVHERGMTEAVVEHAWENHHTPINWESEVKG